MRIYLQQAGNQTGPFDEAAVRERINQGTLSPEVYAWSEGMSDWRPLHEVLTAVPVLSHPPATTPLPGVQAASFPVASGKVPSVYTGTKMPWWAKLLLGCGGLVTVGMISLAAVIVYALHQDQTNHRGSSSDKTNPNWAQFDKEMTDLRDQGKKERENLQAEVDRHMADAEHYTTTKANDPDGSTTTTVTPKDGATGGKPITKRVNTDGKITTTTEDANGNTVVRTEDKNGNVSTVTTPK